MKSLWKRIGKKSLGLARANCNSEDGFNGASCPRDVTEHSNSGQEALLSENSERTVDQVRTCSSEEHHEPFSPMAMPVESARPPATGSFDEVIAEEEEEGDEETEHIKLEEQTEDDAVESVALAPATSEENIDYEGSASYCYGSQFTFHGGLYGYPVAVVRRRPAAVPVIKGFTMTDVDFPLYFSSYDIPVVSASRHASFTRRTRLVRLHNRYTSMPAIRTERPLSRAQSLAEAEGTSDVGKMALPEHADTSSAAGSG